MEKEKLTFRDVYMLPFQEDEFAETYIWSSNGVMTFNALIEDREQVAELLKIINGESHNKINDNVTYDEHCIKIGGEPIFLLRGWGHLTGCGALNLPCHEAANIQDDFANWVVNKLKGIE